MKLLNLLTMALMAIFVSVNITSCSSDEESEELIPVEDDEEYVEIPLKLSINASIDITDEPITKSDYDNPVYALIISSIFSIIYTVNALNLLATYSVMEKDFLNKYKNMININTYIVSFAIVIVCAFVIYCLIHLLNFSVLLYCFDIISNF